ncbi:hypothetical protein [Pseudomonas sp. PDM11]|uniref:hypothetical protein n=1 Tax=Pseudomonas sp. PDM11 TaxID=2769309 RepID=UPI001CE0CE58|nr:hypothetical protein [Pseudomonas sp. PDM11]
MGSISDDDCDWQISATFLVLSNQIERFARDLSRINDVAELEVCSNKMSKLRCKCGHVIIDQSDNLPYKASLLRDRAEYAFWEDVNCQLKPLVEAAQSGDKAAIKAAFGEFIPWVKATDNLEDKLSSLLIQRTSTVYECQSCGRLWIQENAGDGFISYTPEAGEYSAILDVASEKPQQQT